MKKTKNSRKNVKIREPVGLEIFTIFRELYFFSHSYKGIHREMYISFMLATSQNGKKQFFKEVRKKTMKKKLLLPLRNVAKNKRNHEMPAIYN